MSFEYDQRYLGRLFRNQGARIVAKKEDLAYFERITKEHHDPTSDELLAHYNNSGKLSNLIDSSAVLTLNLDSYSLPSQFQTGSAIIIHGKLNSDGVLVVDAVDNYN